jgi:HD-GYP domain-containing protein (c-di-GMP phosphodiesterase class II)
MKDFLSSVLNFFNFWRPTLGRRLTVYFTIFGIIIGYLVLAYWAFSSTNTFIQTSADLIRHHISTLSQKAPGGEILKLLNQKRDDIRTTAKFFQGISSDFNFELYFQDNGGKWQHIFLNPKGIYRSQAVTDAGLSLDLEKAKRNKIMTSSALFYGRNDNVNVKINVSPKGDSFAYILNFNIDRPGIWKLLQKNLYKGILFFAILLVVSHILGHLFSYLIARPIEALSREAAIIASGHFDHRFPVDRKDEIGTLAQSLNTMASHIIDGTKEREDLLIGILIALTRAIDAKSEWTAGHSERVTRYAEDMGRVLQFNEEQMRVLSISAILHDIGKIAVPEQILDKPGKLTDEEFNEVKKHPRTGTNIISSIPSYGTILSGILYHHERWDGTGYPEGLKGEEIPLNARIICVADVYDALAADRPYRKAWSREQALAFFEEQKEKLFDPQLVGIFKERVT